MRKQKFTLFKFFNISLGRLVLGLGLRLGLVLGIGLILVMSSCSKTGSGKTGIGGVGALDKKSKSFGNRERWIDGDTYQMTVYGQWNSNAYYVEGETPPKNPQETNGVSSTLPKSTAGLRADAKIAAKVKALRAFKEAMVNYLASVTKVEDSELISGVVADSLRGLSIASQAKGEEYSKEHEASIVFHFQGANLKSIIDEAVEITLERFDEVSKQAAADAASELAK